MYIYMLRAGQNHYKIGIATNVSKRLASIQTGNSNLVEVVTAKPVENAAQVEQQIHQRLKTLRTNGGTEWFALSPEDAIEIAVTINRVPGLDLSDRLTISAILSNQRVTTKSIEKKLDFVINSYQKDRKPAGTIEPEHYDTKPMKEDLKAMADNELRDKALDIVKAEGKASTSLLQRRLGLGYGRAAKIIDWMESQGYVTAGNANAPRKVLIKP